MHFSIMNNTPIHFIFASALVAVFLFTVFKLQEEQRSKGLVIMHILFIPVLLSGMYVWTLVPFSIPLLIKSVGAMVAYWFMTRIVKNPSTMMNWVLCGAIIAVGGTLAVTMI